LQPAPVTFATKADADLWLASAATDTARGEWVDPRAGNVTLAQYASEWMAGKVRLAPKTVELYQYLLARLILPRLGTSPLNAITPMEIRRWRAELLRAGSPGESTIAKAYRLLSGILSTAVIDNVIPRNPCVEKGAGVERAKEMRAATPGEVAVLAEVIDPRYRALVLTAAYGGCRWGELAGLRQRNLDLDRGQLTVVEQTVELRSGKLVVRAPKTAAGTRVVHLPGSVVTALRLHLAQSAAPDPDGLVFTSEQSGPLRQNNFRNRRWLPAVRAAGLEGLRFHDLRHVAGTLATVSGATITPRMGAVARGDPQGGPQTRGHRRARSWHDRRCGGVPTPPRPLPATALRQRRQPSPAQLPQPVTPGPA
jgi:integrase